MRPAIAASPTCCAPPVLIVTLQLVSPAAPTPALPSGLLVKYTMPASRPRGVNRRYRTLRDWPLTTPTRPSRPTSGLKGSSSAPLPAALDCRRIGRVLCDERSQRLTYIYCENEPGRQSAPD